MATLEHEVKPAAGTIRLKGKAAKWLGDYLKQTEPDAKAQQEQAQADLGRISRAAKRLRNK